MARTYMFTDEGGNIDFRDHNVHGGVSRYFALGTATIHGREALAALDRDLLELRRELAWDGTPHDSYFHATSDPQRIRDAVVGVINQSPVTFDVTLAEKAKIPPPLRSSAEVFYEHMWRLHLEHVAPQCIGENANVLLVAATFGPRRRRDLFRAAIENAVKHCTSPGSRVRVAVVPAASEPGVQVADYGTWAVTRAWERGDDRTIAQLHERVRSQHEATSQYSTRYYGRLPIPMKTFEKASAPTGTYGAGNREDR